jgi:neopullulanase
MAGRDRASYHLAVLLQATLPGAPCTYYGDEIGVEGNHDPDCRRAFPWDEAAWDQDGLAWTKAAYRARHDLPALRRGDLHVVGASGDAVAFVRGTGGGGSAVLVVVNAGESPITFTVNVAAIAGTTLMDVLLPDSASGDGVVVGPEGETTVTVQARAGRILVVASSRA